MSFSAWLVASRSENSRRFGAAVERTYSFTRNSLKICRLRLVGAAFAFVLSGLVPATACAAVLIEPRIGFHGVFQLGRPFPIEIELTNTGRPAEGTLDVRVWKGGVVKGGAPYLISYRREVFLASQANKTVQLTIDPDFVSRPLIVSFSAPHEQSSRELDLRRYFSPAPVLLFMSGGSALPPLASAAATQNRLVSLSPEELPPDSRALLGVSHVILYDQSMRDFSRAQLQALDGWLSAGGQMIIIGSVNYALYQEPGLARFLPVRVTGTKQVSFTPNLGSSEPSVSLGGVWAQTSTVVTGQAVLQASGIPVLVEAQRGRGRIVYLALDVGRPPLSEWNRLPRFLQPLLAPASLDETAPRTDWSEAVFNQLIASPSFISTYVPSGSLLSATVSYLLAVGALTWFWQRRRLALTKLLMALATTACVAMVLGYLHFSRGGNVPDGVLLSSSVLESSGDDFVDAQANLALFSTQLRQYDLQMERGWMDLTPVSLRPRESAEQPVVMQEGAGVSRYRLPLREWDYRLFRLRRIERFPLRASFEMHGDRLSIKVQNRSVNDLADCWLVMPGQRFKVGIIRRGEIWQKSFPLTNPAVNDDSGFNRGNVLNLREITFRDKTKDILFHSSMFPRDGDPRWAGGAAIFFGWVQDPSPQVRIDDSRIQAQDYALFRAVFPLGGGDDE